MIQANGQAVWADLVWVEMLKTWRGNMLPPAPVLTLMWSEAVPLLLALAGSCNILYASLHHGAWTSYTTISSGWVSPTVPQSAALTNSSLHGGPSSELTCTISALFPFPWHWQWGDFSALLDLVGCWLAVPELQHLACQWPFLEQPLQVAFCAGQLSWPGGCKWVQLGHCEGHFCGLFFWGWWPWQRGWMALPAHIAAAPDSMA